MSRQKSDALVFFGASGDLAYKQIFPALAAMVRRDDLRVPIIGVAKSEWSLDDLKKRAKESLDQHGEVDDSVFEKLCSLLRYVDGDYNDPKTFEQLHGELGAARSPLYYLAIPPELFATVAEGLARSENIKNARVVVEKPFGRDLKSARQLNSILHKYFKEENIFRIDHYLGKEPVQNLIYFRFANPSVHAAWSRDYIESVQITMAEKIGLEGRGKLYDEEGAIRDVVQNHMLEVVACLAMECPESANHEAIRDKRNQLLREIKPLTAADVVRGQFAGYRNEKNVRGDSQIETFAALRFQIENDRWRGVPFYVRAGKCLPVSCTEVMVRFKLPAHPVLDENENRTNCYYRLRLSPEVVLAQGVKVKRPGELMVGEPIELIAHF
ncbi:MAG TPA: hypothetical protein V6C72_08520, partial [Chroococcales cyanobacterium]